MAGEERYDVVRDGSHLGVMQPVGRVGGHVIVLPRAARKEVVRHNMAAEDAVVTHVAHLAVEGGDHSQVLWLTEGGNHLSQLGMALGACDKQQ